MDSVRTVVMIVLAAIVTLSAVGKLARQEAVTKNLKAANVPENRFNQLAMVEILGATGLVAGFFWTPIGIAASLGLVLYFVAAVGAHIRAQDKGYANAAVLLVISIGSLVLQV